MPGAPGLAVETWDSTAASGLALMGAGPHLLISNSWHHHESHSLRISRPKVNERKGDVTTTARPRNTLAGDENRCILTLSESE